MTEILRGTDPKAATVFIHGYNVSFEAASLRAAQLFADLSLPGIMGFYSWPSLGNPAGYFTDSTTIEASESHIAKFLAKLACESGVKRINIIAHSMGNRGLLRALQRITTSSDANSETIFENIILAAPDIDTRIFTNLAYLYSLVSRRTTMYVSSRDRALAASGFANGSMSRAGYSPPVTIVSGIDTIEVTSIDLSLLGHSYIGETRDVLHDIFNLLVHNLPPKNRMGLRFVEAAPVGYWMIGG